MFEKELADEVWYWYLTGKWRVPPPPEIVRKLAIKQKIYSLLPSNPHCLECGVPMAGLGGILLRPLGSAPATFSPKFCSDCEKFARKYESGAEVELSMLFADVRGSTPLAESTPAKEFKSLIQRFYRETSHVLVHFNSMVNRLMGDQVSALFVPHFAGNDHAKVAIEAAQEVLNVTGHGRAEGPWVPVGVGVHTGLAYVGAVGSADGVNEIAVLGSAANLCARLSSQAATGEILVSQEAADSAGLDQSNFEQRVLELKGIGHPVPVSVLQTVVTA